MGATDRTPEPKLLTLREAAVALGITTRRPERTALRIIAARERQRGCVMLVRTGTDRRPVYRVGMAALRRYFPDIVRAPVTEAETAVRQLFRGFDERFVSIEAEQEEQRAIIAGMARKLEQLLETFGRHRPPSPRG